MNDANKIKWFDAAMRFGLDNKIHLVMKSKSGGISHWSIVNTENHQVLNSNLEWEVEPPLNKRDESFKIRARFDIESAISLWEQYKMFAM